jgi:hypothetical protein
MIRVTALVLCCLGLAREARANTVVVLGDVRHSTTIDIRACSDDTSCWQDWYRVKLHIKRVILGKLRGRTVTAALLVHQAMYTPFMRPFRLFVLSSIDDAQDRKLLRADYYLKSFDPQQEVYCLNGTPDDIGLPPANAHHVSDGQYCFSISEQGELK